MEERRHNIDEGQVLLWKEGRIRLPRIKGDPGHQDQVSQAQSWRISAEIFYWIFANFTQSHLGQDHQNVSLRATDMPDEHQLTTTTDMATAAS
jgi:hypothetical protein